MIKDICIHFYCIFELKPHILIHFILIYRCTNANIPTLIKSYEGAMQSLSSEDPRRSILIAVCDQMRQSDDDQEEISTVHLSAFRDSIKNISSALK
jgi:hypothetical protein